MAGNVRVGLVAQATFVAMLLSGPPVDGIWSSDAGVCMYFFVCMNLHGARSGARKAA